MRTIDAHVHVWDLANPYYSWLTPEAGKLYRSFSPEEVQRDLERSGVDAAILVQAADCTADSRYLLDVASTHPWVAGVVGWVQLDEPGTAESQLDEFGEHAVFRGVRHLIHDDPRRDFLELATVRASLRSLARRGLVVEIPDAWPTHLTQAIAVAEEIPELRIVLDHLGKPPHAADEFERWGVQLAQIASHGGVTAKLSGLTEATSRYTAEDLRPVWDRALESFGPSRLMWGSDWPISTLESGYSHTFSVLQELIGTLSPHEQSDILGGTATRVYALAD